MTEMTVTAEELRSGNRVQRQCKNEIVAVFIAAYACWLTRLRVKYLTRYRAHVASLGFGAAGRRRRALPHIDRIMC